MRAVFQGKSSQPPDKLDFLLSLLHTQQVNPHLELRIQYTAGFLSKLGWAQHSPLSTSNCGSTEQARLCPLNLHSAKCWS